MRTAARLLTTTLLAPVAIATLATPSFADHTPFPCEHPLCHTGDLFEGEPMDVPDLDIGIPTLPPLPPVPPPPEGPIEVVPIDPCLVLDCDPPGDLAPPTEDPEPEPPGDLAPPADGPDPDPDPEPEPEPPATEEPAEEPDAEPSPAAPAAGDPGPTADPAGQAEPAPQVMATPTLDLAGSQGVDDQLRIVLATAVIGAGLAGAVAAAWLWRRARG